MPDGRPAIPAEIERAVLLEVGYGCPVPGCGWSRLQRAHLIDFAKTKDHSFGNLIGICPNHHDLHTAGVIDTMSLRILKARLAIKRERYNHCEIRHLDICVFRPMMLRNGGNFLHPTSRIGDLRQLVWDGYIEQVGERKHQSYDMTQFRFTTNGKMFVKAWGEADAHLMNEVVNATYPDLDK